MASKLKSTQEFKDAMEAVFTLLGRLGATNRWRGIVTEYRDGSAPVTPLGEQEAAWRSSGG